MHRREFLFGALKAAAAVQLDGMQLAAQLLAGGNMVSKLDTVKKLLLRRGELLSSGEESLQNNWIDYYEESIGVRCRHLDSFGENAALLNPEEAKAFRIEATALRNIWQKHNHKLESEIRAIDKALAQHPKEVEHVLVNMSDGLDTTAIYDARAIIKGEAPPALSHQLNRTGTVTRELDTLTTQAARVTQATRSDPKWQQQRKKALLTSAQKTLTTLSGLPQVAVESRLTKGYGNDDWVVSTRFTANEIGGDVDHRIQHLMTSFMNDLKLAYPERAAASEFLRHARPEQPGYGEHDCERLTLTNPDFALREMLRAAENTYLKRKNALNQLRNVA